MKKAKLILTAVGILSVVGGAVAMKANMRLGTRTCSTVKGTCNITDARYDPKVGTGIRLFCTAFGSTNCQLTQTVTTEE